MKKPYFTTIVAFSTPSGRLHIGHALGQVAGDVASRYAELHGQKSFFPFDQTLPNLKPGTAVIPNTRPRLGINNFEA